MSEPLLEVDGLTVTFPAGVRPLYAVNGVSLSLRRGEALGVVGESGSGKSTLALAIPRLLGPGGRIVGGRISFEGQEVLGLPEDKLQRLRGGRIGMVFQDPQTSLNPSIRVGEQIAETLRVHLRLSPAAAARRAVELLDRVGIADPVARARQYPHQLSGGMQQRAMIALAISCNPGLIILDEPTTALDVTIEAEVLDLLGELKRDLDTSFLFITHNLGVVLRVCDRVAVLYAGQILEESPTRVLFERPLHPYTKGLLSCIPSLAERRAALSYIPGTLPDLTAPPTGCVFATRCVFALEPCADPQALADRAGHPARCWRAPDLAELPWPVADEAAAPPTASGPQAEPLLKVSGLTKHFELGGWLDSLRFGPRGVHRERRVVRAVDGVDLEIRPGETLGLVGESGSGKSTLGRCLLRLIEPSGGAIELHGRDLRRLNPADLRERRRTMQMVFQNPDSSLNPRRTVGQILARPLQLFGLARGADLRERVRELLRTVRLREVYEQSYPHQLSGGEKQRVGIARAIAPRPEFVVCDEPVSALDVSVQAAVLNLLVELQQRLKISYLFISHDLAVVRHIARRIAVMYAGRICEVGTADEIFRPPSHPYTLTLLSAIPVPDVRTLGRERIRPGDDPTPFDGRGCWFKHRCPMKIGSVCDDQPPPALHTSREHVIYCHHSLEELQVDPLGLESDLRAKVRG